MELHEYKAFASCNQGRRIEKTIEFENVFLIKNGAFENTQKPTRYYQLR